MKYEHIIHMYSKGIHVHVPNMRKHGTVLSCGNLRLLGGRRAPVCAL